MWSLCHGPLSQPKPPVQHQFTGHHWVNCPSRWLCHAYFCRQDAHLIKCHHLDVQMKWLTVEEHGECLELPVWKHPGEKGLYVWTSPSMASWAETDTATKIYRQGWVFCWRGAGRRCDSLFRQLAERSHEISLGDLEHTQKKPRSELSRWTRSKIRRHLLSKQDVSCQDSVTPTGIIPYNPE